MNESNDSLGYETSLFDLPDQYYRSIIVSFSAAFLLINGLCFFLAYVPIFRVLPKLGWDSLFKWLAINYSIVGLVLLLDSIAIFAADLTLLMDENGISTNELCTFHFSLVATVIPTLAVCIPFTFVIVKTWLVHRNRVYKHLWLAYAVLSIICWVSAITLGIPLLVPTLFPNVLSFGHICASNGSKASVIQQVKILLHILPFTISVFCLYSIAHVLLQVHSSVNKPKEEYMQLKALTAATLVHHFHTTLSGVGTTIVSTIFQRDGFTWPVLIIVQLSIESSKLIYSMFGIIMIFLSKKFSRSAKELYYCKRKRHHSKSTIFPQ